ncbi:MAG TPA: acetyl-CoA carboxylase biotin carboxyl carrier protein [Candidatus Binataceae bacterium]|nr:acetyl-CoA carboxylase biotin carboxyl carrier protein [Candidatus Binataceae bacterium]
MELREIKALLVLMQEYGLTELEIDDKKKGKLRLVRGAAVNDSNHSANRLAAPAPRPPGPGSSRQTPVPTSRNSGANAPPVLAENQRLVTSPMVGTFYRAAAPDAQPFVAEGDTVRKGQALCIIEAMKMMNEIEAEMAGRVVKILCENAQPVEYGQPLMMVEVA